MAGVVGFLQASAWVSGARGEADAVSGDLLLLKSVCGSRFPN